MAEPDKTIGERNYEQFADRYAAGVETKSHNAHYERPATRSLVPEVDGRHILDAGCGPGLNTEWLLDRGAQVTAVDVTPDFLRITRERVGDRATIQRADLDQPLDFADESFDGVLCALVLDYIADWGPTFREFARVLRPGGWLVCSAGHPFGDWLYFNMEGRYFDIERHTIEWHGFGEPFPQITSYRRPLNAMIDPLLAAGLALEALLEPLPQPSFKEVDPEGYEGLMHGPGFICLRARKGTTP